LFPTLLEFCGVELPPDHPPLDGRSIVPYLEGDEDALPPKESFIYVDPAWQPHEHAPGQRCRAHEVEYQPVPPERKERLPFEPQAVGMRTEHHKLMRNPGPVEGAPPAVDGRVLVHMEKDPKEEVNAWTGASEVGERMEAALRDWFECMKGERHAFYAPRFAIGPGTTNVVWLYAPLRVRGHVRSAALASEGWRGPGDGADYLVEVTEGGRYGVTLHCRELRGEGVTLLLRVGSAQAQVRVRSEGETDVGEIALPAGAQPLRLEVVGAEPPGGAELAALTALRFTGR
jgi:hypothetical protein